MFLIFTPAVEQVLILVLAAVLPAAYLMHYVWKEDTVEKEPCSLLASLIIFGVLAALAAMVLEIVINGNILTSFTYPSKISYIIIDAFSVGLIEEGCKFFFLKKKTWKNPNFNYRFDGIVYAVFVSLGFAAFENILYVFSYGLETALFRALLAIPAHMGFAVFMGSHYGRAKGCSDIGDRRGMKINLWAGYLQAVILHGFYDTCAVMENETMTIVFFAFVVLMDIAVIRMIKKDSREDRPI